MDRSEGKYTYTRFMHPSPSFLYISAGQEINNPKGQYNYQPQTGDYVIGLWGNCANRWRQLLLNQFRNHCQVEHVNWPAGRTRLVLIDPTCFKWHLEDKERGVQWQFDHWKHCDLHLFYLSYNSYCPETIMELSKALHEHLVIDEFGCRSHKKDIQVFYDKFYPDQKIIKILDHDLSRYVDDPYYHRLHQVKNTEQAVDQIFGCIKNHLQFSVPDITDISRQLTLDKNKKIKFIINSDYSRPLIQLIGDLMKGHRHPDKYEIITGNIGYFMTQDRIYDPKQEEIYIFITWIHDPNVFNNDVVYHAIKSLWIHEEYPVLIGHHHNYTRAETLARYIKQVDPTMLTSKGLCMGGHESEAGLSMIIEKVNKYLVENQLIE